MIRVLVVCTGNVCRSPMAEGLLRKLVREENRHGEIVVESAGTYPLEGSSASNDAIETAAEHGIDIRGHVARPLNGRMVERADLILVMEEEHRDRLIAAFPSIEKKVHLLTTFGDRSGDPLGVADPIGQGPTVYRSSFQTIQAGLEAAMPAILEMLKEEGTDDGAAHRVDGP